MKKSIAILLVCFLFLSSFCIYAAPATDDLNITVHKVTAKPTIDGKIGEGEWGEAVMYQESGVGLTYFPDADGGVSDQAVKANIYMLWDESGYYVAASVEDSVHFNQYSNLDIWNGDAFEFDSNFNPDDYSDRNRQCYGVNNDGEVYGGSFKVASGVDWAENSDIEYKEFTAVHAGTTTTYEFFVPWENFCPDGAAFAKVGNIFRGNVQFHLAVDGDYVGCQRYSKMDGETATYPNFILADAAPAPAPVAETAAPVAEVAAPVEEAPTVSTPAAPQTSDGIVVFGIALLLGMVGILAFKKVTQK